MRYNFSGTDEQSLKPGDNVKRTDTDRLCTVVNTESHFVTLCQYLNGSVEWISKGLLERIESKR